MNEVIKKSIPDELIYLAKLINSSGYKFYIVGGFVRDIFIGTCDAYENDIDVCGDCPPEIFSNIISNNKRIKQCEANFPLGTLKLIIDDLDIEYTCFRTESYRGDGYHTPNKIAFTKDIYKDAERRDFTINALYLDPLTYQVTDFFDGIAHISQRLIKTVRQSTEVFTEDALRILRMCRFSAKLGFAVDPETSLGARKCAHLLKNISNERIGAELDKILWDTEYLNWGIDAIYEAQINTVVCPDVLKETAQMVCTANKDRYVRWAVFLSDSLPEGAEKYIINLALGKDFAKEVSRMIANADLARSDINNIILLFAKIGETAAIRLINFIINFSEADAMLLQKIFNDMEQNDQFLNYKELMINGSDIMDILNVKGPAIKVYKDKLYEYAVLNPGKNNYKDLKKYLMGLS